MFNDNGLLRLGQIRAVELLREAEQHRLAEAVRRGRSYPGALRLSAIASVVALGAIVFALVR
jgi:hypothetical protein